MLKGLKFILILIFILFYFQAKAQLTQYWFDGDCKNVMINDNQPVITIKLKDTVINIRLPVYKVLACNKQIGDSIIFLSYTNFILYNYSDLMILYLKPKLEYKKIKGFVNFDPYIGNIAYFPFSSQYVKIYNIYLLKDIDSIRIAYNKLSKDEFANYFSIPAIKKDTIVFFLDRFHYPKTPLLPEFVNKAYTAVKIHYSPADKRRLERILRK